jgi:N-acetylglutamate synthase-like GNAT family acetyltransferase
MTPYTVFPDRRIQRGEVISDAFRALGVSSLIEACRYVHELPYGYNSDRDDLMILFKEKMGTCSTKHAVIATLAAELGLPIVRGVGVYPMTEAVVTGTDKILAQYNLPYVPMIHCFLEYGRYRVDLTEGNRNGKNRPIEDFLFTDRVAAAIPARDEYMIYRKALSETILKRPELQGVDLKTILHAREEGLKLLKANLQTPSGGSPVEIQPNPDAAEVIRLLSASALPTADLTPRHMTHFFGAAAGGDLKGVVGLELYGGVALLRSLAVAEERRATGLGSRLVERAERHASERGVTSLYLLTATAEAFFRHRGYDRIPREEAPEAIKATPEFTGICPLSAAFMVKQLEK